MTLDFCNFRQQNPLLTYLYNVDNYVEIGDYSSNRPVRLMQTDIGVKCEMKQFLHPIMLKSNAYVNYKMRRGKNKNITCNFKGLLILYIYCDKIHKVLRICTYINM